MPRKASVVTGREFLRRIDEINIWRSGGQRAPHKPLLLLLAMGRLATGAPRRATYVELETPLRDLLRRFGPPRKVLHPEYPFAHLATDGIWDVDDEAISQGGQVRRAEPVARGLRAGFPEALFALLSANPQVVGEATRRLLDAHFAESLHADILEAVGLRPPGEVREVSRRPRDPAFRTEVLREYERRCAVCGFDVRVADDLLGLEAAHIKWHAAGGPDEVSNGLALCGFHHRALDRGALGVEPAGTGYRVVVSGEVNGDSAAVRWLLDYAGEALRRPQHDTLQPDPTFVDWHRHEVFREPARPMPTDRSRR